MERPNRWLPIMLLMVLVLPSAVIGSVEAGAEGVAATSTAPAGVLAERLRLILAESRRAELEERDDSIIYRAGSRRKAPPPTVSKRDEELQSRRSWEDLKSLGIQKRYDKEPSLTFPADGFSRPRK